MSSLVSGVVDGTMSQARPSEIVGRLFCELWSNFNTLISNWLSLFFVICHCKHLRTRPSGSKRLTTIVIRSRPSFQLFRLSYNVSCKYLPA